MKKGIGESVLESIATPMIPLGADPKQMRADQDRRDLQDGDEPPKDTPESQEPETPEHDHRISDEPPMEISKSAIRTFHAFYIEGKHEQAAEAIADALSLSKDDGPTVSETSEVEWAEFIAEASATKFNFLRKSMLKFHTFLGTAKSSWDKLSDKQKESAVKFLQTKASKMATELKSLVSGLTAKSPPEKILMAAMMAYMFGIGLSGEGAVVPESTDDEK